VAVHTILGANGVIGRELSALLRAKGGRVRQVSRTPTSDLSGDELVPADLTDAVATQRAIAGSSVCYLVAGLKYDSAVWETQWPKIMRNVIDGCARHGARLVFFDNVYAYGLVEGEMTEATPFNPISRKGEVRARIASTLLDEISAGNLTGMIVRAADFYGPGATLSMTHAMIFERLRAGKTPQWIADPTLVHTFTFTPDAARTIDLLASRDDAYGRTWHALTSPDPISVEGLVRLACDRVGRPYRLQVAPRWVLRLMERVVPVLRENREMMYQFDRPYRFSSARVEAATGARPTPYADGIVATL
jgi:nucleoside-diphosphate-sugar epimerase